MKSWKRPRISLNACLVITKQTASSRTTIDPDREELERRAISPNASPLESVFTYSKRTAGYELLLLFAATGEEAVQFVAARVRE